MPLRIATPRSAFRALQTSKPLPHRLYSSSSPSTLKINSIPAPHAGSIKILSLNRPNSRNAISRQLLNDLHKEVELLHTEASAGPTRALILASESPAAFCAGADLKERLGFSAQETKDFLAKLRHTFTRLSTLPIPTISAVASVAFGGGLELALTSTFRVFGSGASVALPETRLAIIPGAGGTYRLPALVGTSRARDLVLTGRRVTAAEAYFIGLCDRLVEVTEAEVKEGKANEKVLGQAVMLAREVCEGGPVAVGAALDAVNGWGAGEEVENMMYERVLGTEDRLEALRAFGEKRAPMFKGR